MKQLSEGAEAKIYLAKTAGTNVVIKNRIEKKYREKALDDSIRAARNRIEARILYKVSRAGVPAPRLIAASKHTIVMSWIDGRMLNKTRHTSKIMERAGEHLASLHNADISHGDYTPANLMVGKNEVYVIDFGLASITNSLEEKATDLLLMKRSTAKSAFRSFLKGYERKSRMHEEIVARLDDIERRARYQSRTLG